MDFAPVDECSCLYCTGARKPEPEPCEGCKAKDKTITELIAALSLQREPVWPVQHPHPPCVPSVSPSLPSIFSPRLADYTVSC